MCQATNVDRPYPHPLQLSVRSFFPSSDFAVVLTSAPLSSQQPVFMAHLKNSQCIYYIFIRTAVQDHLNLGNSLYLAVLICANKCSFVNDTIKTDNYNTFFCLN